MGGRTSGLSWEGPRRGGTFSEAFDGTPEKKETEATLTSDSCPKVTGTEKGLGCADETTELRGLDISSVRRVHTKYPTLLGESLVELVLTESYLRVFHKYIHRESITRFK